MTADRPAPRAPEQPMSGDEPDLTERLSADADGSLAFTMVQGLHARASGFGKLSGSEDLHLADIYSAYTAAAEIVEHAALELRARRHVR